MSTDKAIITAFLVSFVGHCIFLCAPLINEQFPKLNTPKEIVVKIDVEELSSLPRIDNIGKEKKIKEVLESPEQFKLKQQNKSEEITMKELVKYQTVEKKEETCQTIKAVNQDAETMFRYQDVVKQKIQEARRYPLFAKKQGIEGIVHLSFIVLANGLSSDIKIIRSSGFSILDEEAVNTIKRATPFPPIPKEIEASFVEMEVYIVFTLK
ncbi:MAG: energy transducer TonB [Candidatus Omnitrophica bacterium]|nr:energy transducer TonB [Candidatus Omnitrophota bacterium]